MNLIYVVENVTGCYNFSNTCHIHVILSPRHYRQKHMLVTVNTSSSCIYFVTPQDALKINGVKYKYIIIVIPWTEGATDSEFDCIATIAWVPLSSTARRPKLSCHALPLIWIYLFSSCDSLCGDQHPKRRLTLASLFEYRFVTNKTVSNSALYRSLFNSLVLEVI